MLLTDKQIEKWIERFEETYKNDASIEEDWRMGIPVIYSDNPEETEKEHMEMWKEELRKLMWEYYDAPYVHRWWRKDTLWNVQFWMLWLYNSPYFKSNEEKNGWN